MPLDTTVPPIILDLVARFAEHRESYHRGDYNETQLRRDYLDPFFEALGWDVNNRQGYAEAYREVIHEDALRVEQSVKAPDYGFRIGGVRKFFVEAKKPSVNIEKDAGSAFQRQIEAVDRQIDRLVYELYGLTEDEIRIVEEATR